MTKRQMKKELERRIERAETKRRYLMCRRIGPLFMVCDPGKDGEYPVMVKGEYGPDGITRIHHFDKVKP
jgi:hypothetical protein